MSTKVPSAKLLFGRDFKTRLLKVIDSSNASGANNIMTSDAAARARMKLYAHEQSHVKPLQFLKHSNFANVRLKKTIKLSRSYNPNVYCVTFVSGNMITAEYARQRIPCNQQFFKKVIGNLVDQQIQHHSD